VVGVFMEETILTGLKGTMMPEKEPGTVVQLFHV
jgi:hypothetical protein